MSDQRNIIIAIVLSVAIMFGFQYLFPRKPTPAPVATEAGQAPQAAAQAGQTLPGAAPLQAPGGVRVDTREGALAASPRISIKTPSVNGSISLKGARLDDLALAQFHETADPGSPEITLLSPSGAPGAYFAQQGWFSPDAKLALPGDETLWQAADQGALTPEHPVTLTWDNGQGLRFTRVISIDADYLFTVKQTVQNSGSAAVVLNSFALISRTGKPKTEGYYILHEGPLAVTADGADDRGTLKEYEYKDLDKEGTIKKDSTGGWLGLTDKYWMTALAPDQAAKVNLRFNHFLLGDRETYQVDFAGEPQILAPGAAIELTDHLFAGAKKVDLMERYAETPGIKRFDLAIDFGWFAPITKPLFYALTYIHKAVGNFGLAIMAITVLVKLALFPLANKSYRSMSKMKTLQPETKRLQERFAEDKPRLQQEIMALYKREKVNPVSGCLPMFIQIPIFFSLYKVLFITLEMRQAPFFGWIQDLASPDPTTLFNLFGLIPWDPPMFLHLGIWPLIMGATMFFQQRLNPQPADPVQAKMFMVLPLVFTFMLAKFPAGLVIYWSWSNLLSIVQQWVIMKRATKNA